MLIIGWNIKDVKMKLTHNMFLCSICNSRKHKVIRKDNLGNRVLITYRCVKCGGITTMSKR